jgi:hypothetical protein
VFFSWKGWADLALDAIMLGVLDVVCEDVVAMAIADAEARRVA